MTHLPYDIHRRLDTDCACFPGTCRGGQVVDGRTVTGQRCKAQMPAEPKGINCKCFPGNRCSGQVSECDLAAGRLGKAQKPAVVEQTGINYVNDIRALAQASGAQIATAEHGYKKAERSFDDALAVLTTWGFDGPPPIDMILHCPVCGKQHIDAPEGFKATGQCECDVFGSCEVCTANEEAYREFLRDGPWTNPPHRSHLCHECGHIWRPADVPTNGVAEIRTKGKNDSQRQEDVTVAAYRSPEEPAAFAEWWKREYAKDKGLFRGARAGYLQAWLAGGYDALISHDRTAVVPSPAPSTVCGEVK